MVGIRTPDLTYYRPQTNCAKLTRTVFFNIIIGSRILFNFHILKSYRFYFIAWSNLPKNGMVKSTYTIQYKRFPSISFFYQTWQNIL